MTTETKPQIIIPNHRPILVHDDDYAAMRIYLDSQALVDALNGQPRLDIREFVSAAISYVLRHPQILKGVVQDVIQRRLDGIQAFFAKSKKPA